MAFKIVVVGCGGIAWRGHGPAYQRYAATHPDTRLAASVDTDSAKAAAFAAAFGFANSYTDIEEALRAEQPDVVCLLVPAAHVAALAVSILEAGYPLIMEKPPGVSQAEALRIMQAARRPDGSEVPNRVAFNRRYMPLVTQAQDWVRQRVAADRLHHVSYTISRVGRTDEEDASVTAIHGIDTLRWLTGSDYQEIRLRYRPLPHLGARTANVTLEGRFHTGVTFSLHFYPVAGAVYERVTAMGEEESMQLRLPFWTSADSPGSLAWWRGNTLETRCTGDGEAYETNGFYEENAGFFAALRAGNEPDGGIATAIQSVEVAEAVLRRAAVYTDETTGWHSKGKGGVST